MILGVDIGTRQDHTALVWLEDWDITRVERWPLGIEYPEIISRLRPLIKAADHTYLDESGVGDPVCSTLQGAGLAITGIRIIGRGNGKRAGSNWTVPKRLLVQALLQALGRIQITAPDPGRSALRSELIAFNQLTGRHTRFEAKSGKHDDLVIAAALAVFGRISS